MVMVGHSIGWHLTMLVSAVQADLFSDCQTHRFGDRVEQRSQGSPKQGAPINSILSVYGMYSASKGSGLGVCAIGPYFQTWNDGPPTAGTTLSWSSAPAAACRSGAGGSLQEMAHTPGDPARKP